MDLLSHWWKSPVWEIDTGFNPAFNLALAKEIRDIGETIAASETLDKISLWDYSRPHLDILKSYILDTALEMVARDIPEVTELNLKLKYSMGWVNVKGPGESIEAHAHNDASLTATYYVKAQENCGDLVIYSYDGFRKIKPKAGKLVIFPAYVMHEVETNRSDKLRISLSTDMQQVVDPDVPNAMVIKSWADSFKRLSHV
jgi:hypothetical protein